MWDVAVGTAGYYRVDDWLYLQTTVRTAPECVQVTALDIPNSRITVARAQLNTQASTHTTGDTLYRLTTKWICTGIRMPTPDEPFLRVEAAQMPNNYFPTGRVTVAGYPNWPDATTEQQLSAGWASLRNGRVVDEDPDSAISYVGPSTGRYIIT